MNKKNYEQNLKFFKEFIHIPHWKRCWKFDEYCEYCERECKELGIKYNKEKK